MPELIVAWLECPETGRAELVALTSSQRTQLLARDLPCPSCTKPCAPTLEPIPQTTDLRVMSWRDGAWHSGFALGADR